MSLAILLVTFFGMVTLPETNSLPLKMGAPLKMRAPLGVQGEGVFLGNPEDSVWEDWGRLPSLKLTAKAPENRPKPKKKTHLPTIHF